MITRLDPIKRTRNIELTVATGQTIITPSIEYVLIIHAYGSDKKGRIHTTTISDVAHGFHDMVQSAYNKIEDELHKYLTSHNITLIARHCTCGHLRSKQDGYTRLNDFNDWGCGRCRKPTSHYLKKVIIPRESHGTIMSLTAE